MSDKSLTATATAAASSRLQAWTDAQRMAVQKRSLLAAIRAKWDKLGEREVSELRNEDELALLVAATYGLEPGTARRDVAAVVNGRLFHAPAPVVEPGKVLPFRQRQSAGK